MGGGEDEELEILYFVSENITVSWLRGIWLSPSIELAENGIPGPGATAGLSCICQKNEFAQGAGAIYRENNGRGE